LPKPKPDQVIRHEIVFGRSERDLIEGALVAYQVNKIATPAVALISDISAMTLIFSIIAGYLGWEFIVSPGLTEIGQIYTDFNAQYQAYKQANPDVREYGTDVVIDTITGIPVGSPVTRQGLRALLDYLL
tara:strand:+ start:79 stop:468 length:390 start_codon:yes stop_codon:yes gene_type:complete